MHRVRQEFTRRDGSPSGEAGSRHDPVFRVRMAEARDHSPVLRHQRKRRGGVDLPIPHARILAVLDPVGMIPIVAHEAESQVGRQPERPGIVQRADQYSGPGPQLRQVYHRGRANQVGFALRSKDPSHGGKRGCIRNRHKVERLLFGD